jgi:hypothetical protein
MPDASVSGRVGGFSVRVAALVFLGLAVGVARFSRDVGA